MHKEATTAQDKDLSFMIDLLKEKEALIKGLTETVNELESKLKESRTTAKHNKEAGESWQDRYIELVNSLCGQN